MKFLTCAFTLAVLLANPVAAFTMGGMNDHGWTRQAHVEVVTGSSGGSKDHSRVK